MTAHAMKSDEERCLGAGMDSCVSKPIKPEALFAALAASTCKSSEGPVPRLSAIIDWELALRHARGDVDLFRELTVIFLEEWVGWRKGMAESLASGDYERLRLIAHTVKGSLGTFAAGEACAAEGSSRVMFLIACNRKCRDCFRH